MIGALGQDRHTTVGRRHSPPSALQPQTATDRPRQSAESLTPPAWIAHLPSGHGLWRAWSLEGAAGLVAVAVTLTRALGPLSAAAALYLPALLLVAAVSRGRWPAYGGILLVVLLTHLAYLHAPQAVHAALPGRTTWPWYLVTRALTYSLVVLITQALVHAVATVRRYVVALEDAYARAWTLALTDPLTELANRRHFDQHLEATITQCRQEGTAVALLLGVVTRKLR